MTKQAERDYPLRVDPRHLYSKPYDDPRILREFAMALELLRFQVPHGAVLDLGCGPGWSSLFLARAGYDVHGVDISERMIDIARERAETDGLDITFSVGDIEELDLERKDFDAVLLFDSLHHCPGYAQVLRQACTHLRPGGCLLLLEPSWLHLISPHAQAATRQFGVTELGFTRFGLRRTLKRAGFRRVVHHYDPGSVYSGLTGFLLANVRLWLGRLTSFPRLKQIVIAYK